MVITTIYGASQVDDNTNIQSLNGKCGFFDLFMTCADYPDQKADRIVGGENAKKGEFPWQANLVNKTGHHFCGGTLLCEKFVVTAAHCIEVEVNEDVLVVLGDHRQYETDPEEIIYAIKSKVIHPSWIGFWDFG